MEKTKRAYVYTEINAPEGESPDVKRYFTVHYAGNPGNGCHRMQSSDKRYFVKTLGNLRKKGVDLVSKLPPRVLSEEGTISRTPFDLFSLSQTPASNKRNK